MYRATGDDFFIAWSESGGGGGNFKLYGELRNASDAALLRDDILLSIRSAISSHHLPGSGYRTASGMARRLRQRSC